MSIYRYLLSYILFYAKSTAKNLLSSTYCVNSRFYTNYARRRVLSRINKYKSRFPKDKVLPDCIEIELTNNCNLDCVFCPNSMHIRERGVMPFQVFRNIIDKIAKTGKRHIVISGFGESLLDKDIINKLDYIYDKKAARFIELVTNGCFLTEKICQAICGKKVLDSLCISIDAADSETYQKIHSYDLLDLVVKNLKHLKNVKNRYNSSYPFVSVRFKNFSFTKGQFKKFTNKFSPLVDEVMPYINISNWPESGIRIDSDKAKNAIKVSCPNLWEGMRINWNGDVILCCVDYEGKVVFGNINKQEIVDIWNNSLIGFYRENHINFNFNCLRICKDCNINTNLIFPW